MMYRVESDLVVNPAVNLEKILSPRELMRSVNARVVACFCGVNLNEALELSDDDLADLAPEALALLPLQVA